jgi:hypothetical protein
VGLPRPTGERTAEMMNASDIATPPQRISIAYHNYFMRIYVEEKKSVCQEAGKQLK